MQHIAQKPNITVEGGARDVQGARHLLQLVRETGQRPLQRLALCPLTYSLERATDQQGIHLGQLHVIGFDEGAAAHDHRPLNPVAQLPHIPRPAIGLHGLARLAGEAEHPPAPHFRQNDFYGGLAAGVTAITTLLEQEKLPPAKRSSSAVQTDDGGGWITLMVIGLFLVVFKEGQSRWSELDDRFR